MSLRLQVVTAVSLGECLPAFWRLMVPSSARIKRSKKKQWTISPWLLPWQWRHYDPSKPQEPFTQQHSSRHSPNNTAADTHPTQQQTLTQQHSSRHSPNNTAAGTHPTTQQQALTQQHSSRHSPNNTAADTHPTTQQQIPEDRNPQSTSVTKSTYNGYASVYIV
jgi:hypothetical protein